MSDETVRRQEPVHEWIELKHLAVEIEKGLNLNNLAQSIDQQLSTPSSATQNDTNPGDSQTDKK